jgi:hypothetical protein
MFMVNRPTGGNKNELKKLVKIFKYHILKRREVNVLFSY